MRKIWLFVSIMSLLFAGAVNAHGPVRAKTTAKAMIDAPAEKVWDIIKNYDKIAVMKAGKIVELGSYDELLAKKGMLYELVGGKN